MTRSLALVLGLLVVGCGPLVAPMTVRLKAEDQQTVDGMWVNMLTPVDRLDRGLLLDVVAAGYLYQLGVDSLHMTAVKHVNGMRVVMEVDCDRANPEADQFTIAVADGGGRTIRRERYSRGEVEASLEADRAAEAAERQRAGAAESPEQRERRVEREARRERMLAATQPARVETTKPALRGPGQE